MKHEQMISAASETFAEHVEKIILRNKALKDDFRQRMSGIFLSDAQLSLMELFASASLVEEFQARSEINWWHIFTDPFTKTLLPLKLGMADLEQDSLSSLIVFGDWNVRNFRLILNLEMTDIAVPPFPASVENLPTVPVLLAYLEQEMLPAVKRHYEAITKFSLPEIEGRLAEKAVLYELEHAPGVETLAPISPAVWYGRPAP